MRKKRYTLWLKEAQSNCLGLLFWPNVPQIQ
jgi:hypothetical protein